MNFDLLSLFCLAIAALLLIILSIIDLRVRLLPTIYVFPFAILGPLFHCSEDFRFLSLHDIALGGLIGFGFLYILRFAANAYYKQDALGLGDVKLMGAAGLWLGIEGILIALTIGAFAGLLHGIIYAFWLAIKNKSKPNFHRLAIPAGPGFIAGIVLSFLGIVYGYPEFLGLYN